VSGPSPIGATGQALRVLELRQQVSAHNLANSSTPGFRADRVFTLAGAEGGGPVAEQARTITPGPVSPTSRPLDLALEGEGFFVVSTPDGERLTRQGSFHLDADRRLVDTAGNPVQGQGGDLILPPGEPVFDATGGLHVDGVRIDALRIERPVHLTPAPDAPGGPAPEEGAAAAPDGELQAGVGRRLAEATLLHEAGGLLALPEGVGLEPVGTLRLHQGALEASNVEPVLAMTDMIEIQRSYATLQRSMHVLDGVLDKVANNLGRVS
jgi:flagellar basal-body rod protein FlgF